MKRTKAGSAMRCDADRLPGRKRATFDIEEPRIVAIESFKHPIPDTRIPTAPSPPLDQWRAADGTLRIPYTKASFWLPLEDMPAPPTAQHVTEMAGSLRSDFI